jgi:adenylate cyclase class 2
MTGAGNQEIEVKFCVRALSRVQTRLEALGARVAQPRALERNLRFDTPGGELRQAGQVLRLRQDAGAQLTFKGPGEVREGVQHRAEIELSVDDFERARAFVEALGYGVVMAYEKYRATYALGDTLVALDELPFGSFVEVEGAGAQVIARVAGQLGLDWETRINASYVALFDCACAALGLSFRDLSFENFRGVSARPEHLGVRYAD